jgi:tRNA-specific 2-thiouridylase
MCNQNLKFGRLIDRATQPGADFIATSHFAQIEKSADAICTRTKVSSNPVTTNFSST